MDPPKRSIASRNDVQFGSARLSSGCVADHLKTARLDVCENGRLQTESLRSLRGATASRFFLYATPAVKGVFLKHSSGASFQGQP